MENTKEIIIKKILDYLAISDHSVKHLTKNLLLLKKRYPKNRKYQDFNINVINEAIEEIKRAGIINEERFIKNALERSMRSLYGLRRIRFNLMRQGYPKIMIEKIMSEFTESKPERNFERISNMAKRKKEALIRAAKDDKRKLMEVKPKLFQYLSSRGFATDEVLKIIKIIDN